MLWHSQSGRHGKSHGLQQGCSKHLQQGRQPKGWNSFGSLHGPQSQGQELHPIPLAYKSSRPICTMPSSPIASFASFASRLVPTSVPRAAASSTCETFAKLFDLSASFCLSVVFVEKTVPTMQSKANTLSDLIAIFYVLIIVLERACAAFIAYLDTIFSNSIKLC